MLDVPQRRRPGRGRGIYGWSAGRAARVPRQLPHGGADGEDFALEVGAKALKVGHAGREGLH
jgi:hypothetical protein